MWRFHKSSDTKNVMPEHKTEGRVCRRAVIVWIERALLVAGLALVIFYGAARTESWLASRSALEKFAEIKTAVDVQNASADKSTDKNTQSNEEINSQERLELPNLDFSLWDKQRVTAYKQNIANQSEVPLAVLRIPKIRLEAPLFEGTDDLTLNHGVGRIAGTSRPGESGNIGVAGHRDGFFRGLKDVSVGDVIELNTLQGTDTYIVDRIQIVTPRQVEVLRPTTVPSLTLVTCYPFYFFGSAPQRYIVTASLSPEKTASMSAQASARQQL
jgi:sortase A